MKVVVAGRGGSHWLFHKEWQDNVIALFMQTVCLLPVYRFQISFWYCQNHFPLNVPCHAPRFFKIFVPVTQLLSRLVTIVVKTMHTIGTRMNSYCIWQLMLLIVDRNLWSFFVCKSKVLQGNAYKSCTFDENVRRYVLLDISFTDKARVYFEVEHFLQHNVSCLLWLDWK